MQALVLGNLLYVGCVCLCIGEWGEKAEAGRLTKNEAWPPVCLQDGLVKEAKDRQVKSSPLQGKGEMSQEASGNSMND